MAFKLGFVTIGSPARERQQEQSVKAQTAMAGRLAALAEEQQAYYSQYMPNLLRQFYGMAQETPNWLEAQRQLMLQDIQRQTRGTLGSLATTLGGSGMLSSGQSANWMAGGQRAGLEALTRGNLQFAQAADQRQQQLMQAIAGLVQGQGAGAMGGMQAASGVYGQAGQQWGDLAAQSMAPFNALMQLAGTIAGAYAGGAPGAMIGSQIGGSVGNRSAQQPIPRGGASVSLPYPQAQLGWTPQAPSWRQNPMMQRYSLY